MVRINPFYLIGSSLNTDYEEFKKEFENAKANWNVDQNPQDPNGVTEIYHQIRQLVEPLVKNPEMFQSFKKALDSILMEYKSLGSNPDLFTYPCEFQIDDFDDTKEEEKFLVIDPEFPQFFTGIKRILDYERKIEKKPKGSLNKREMGEFASKAFEHEFQTFQPKEKMEFNPDK